MPIDFDPGRRQDHADPYAFYRTLRDEAPVHRYESTGILGLSRYDGRARRSQFYEVMKERIGRCV